MTSVPFFDTMIDNLGAYVIGIDSSTSLAILAFVFVAVLLIMALAGRFPFELAVIIIAPALIIAGLNGVLPGVAVGAGIMIFGVIFTLIIIAAVSGR